MRPSVKPSQLEFDFSAGLFDGLAPGTKIGGKQRKKFKWTTHATTEERLLVTLRCMRRVGFETIGGLLAAMFAKDAEYSTHPTVYHTICAFLQCRSKDSTTHPVAIIDLIYHHKKSQIQ
jgi:hypothetical protein